MCRLPLLVASAALLLACVAGPARAQTAEPPIYRVVVFGDSYGSGEGAPGTPGRYASDGTGGGDPRAVWSGSSADRAFTGDTETGLRGARRCHRSPRATAAKAARTLQQRFPGVDVEFRSFACSGARVDVGVLGPYAGAEETDGTVPDDDDTPVPAQVVQANDHLAGLTAARRIDALVMNIGGNNLGFAEIIKKCTELPAGVDPCSPAAVSSGGGNDDAKNLFETGAGSEEGAASIGLDDLDDHLRRLDDAIDRTGTVTPRLAVRPRDVVLTGAPDVLGGGFAGCSGLTGLFDYENRLREDERGWLATDIVPRLVGAMDEGADDEGWDFIDMRPAFANGICAASGRGINRNRDALPTQGATINASAAINVSHGWAHPNDAGFTAMGALLADGLQGRLVERFRPPRPVGARVEEVLELRDRVELTYTHAAVADFTPRPFGRQSAPAGPVATGFPGQRRFEVPVVGAPANATITARSCGPLGADATGPRGCSFGSLPVPVLTGTPGAPTLASARPDPAGVRLRWTPSATAPPLRRFVVEAEPDDPVSLDPLEAFTGTGETTLEPALPGGSGPLGEFKPRPEPDLPPSRFVFGPSVREAVVPFGVRFRVRECTDRGCGAGSNERRATTGIDGTDLQLSRTFLQGQLTDVPIGMVAARVRERVRRGRTFSVHVGWTAWRGWRALRDLDVRLLDRTGTLARLRLDPRTGRVVLRGRGARTRAGRTRGRRTLRSGPVRLLTRSAVTLRVPSTAAFRLPLRLGRRAARGPVEVRIGARDRRGRRQAPRPVARFTVVR